MTIALKAPIIIFIQAFHYLGTSAMCSSGSGIDHSRQQRKHDTATQKAITTASPGIEIPKKTAGCKKKPLRNFIIAAQAAQAKKKQEEEEARTSSRVGLRSSTASAVPTVSLTPPPPTSQPGRKVNKRPRPPSRPSTRSNSRAHPQRDRTPPDRIDAMPAPPTQPGPKESHWTQKKKSLESQVSVLQARCVH